MKARQRLAQRGEDINYLKVARRMRTAVQIADAMNKDVVKKQLDFLSDREKEIKNIEEYRKKKIAKQCARKYISVVR